MKIPAPLTLPPPKEVVIGKEPLTAGEAVAIALKNQPDIIIAGANLLISHGRVQQANSDLLPNFVASGNYSRSTTFRGGGGTGANGGNSFTTNVSVDQLLFDFGRTRDALRQQQALERASLHNFTRTQQTVALDVRQAFYTLRQDLAFVAMNEADIANRQRQVDEAQARLNSGLGAPSDLVQAKTNLANSALTLSSSRDTALTAQTDLARLLGIDPRTPIVPATSGEAALTDEADVEKMVATALENRPDVKAAQEQITAARYAISVASKGNLPRVTATAGVGSRGQNDPLATQTGTFGINVTWNFADSGFTAGAVKEARGSEQIARANLIAVTQTAVSDVSQAYLDLQSALQRVDLAAVAVANAQELVRISEGRFTGGIGTFLEVTNAQNSLVSALRSQIQAQLDVQRARARLRTAIGLP